MAMKDKELLEKIGMTEAEADARGLRKEAANGANLHSKSPGAAS